MILSARDISQQLNTRADSYSRWLYPNGKLESGNWCVGSVDGEKGGSLRIQVTGPRAGIFADFAGSEKGDLLTLTTHARKCTLGEAIKVAKEWLGIRDPQSEGTRKAYGRPKTSGVRKLAEESEVRRYLISERKLSEEILVRFKVSESKGENGTEIALPSFSPSGELVNIKYIAIKRNDRGKKLIRQAGGCAPGLFGWQAVDCSAREILITEGEIDAMTWTQIGFPSVSIPWGAGNDDWIDYEWDTLQQFDTIWLAFDDDKEGKEAVEKAARRLGLYRCLIVRIPGHKDGNAALQKGFEARDFSATIAAAKPISPQQIKSPSGFRDKVIEKFWPTGGIRPGFCSELFDHNLFLRPGETTVWTGISGHGKSALLNQLMLEAVLKGYRVAIASMEMPGHDTMHRMICQSEMNTLPTREEITTVLEWLAGKLWIYDLMGNVSPKLVLQLMEYSFARHGVNLFLIDSLAKISIASDDYEGQRIFLNDVCSFSRDTGTHVNLVAHARKGRDESDAPGKLDVKGSSDIINQPDNVLTVKRDKSKDEERAKGMEASNGRPDAIVFCSKQRENGNEFVIPLKFERSVYRYSRMGNVIPENLSILDRSADRELPMQVAPN